MARKTKQESLETREQLLDAAVAIFAHQGVANSSLNDIAIAAGVTRGAIYWHFKNKVDIFQALCHRMHTGIDQVEQACLERYPHDPLYTLRHLLIYVMQLTVNDPHHRSLMNIVFHKCEFVGEMAPLKDVRLALDRDRHSRLANLLSKCIDQQQLPTSLDINMAVIIIKSYMCGLMENWLFMPDNFKLAEDAPRFTDALIDMLRLSPVLQMPQPASMVCQS